jgi:hypothetical protein
MNEYQLNKWAPLKLCQVSKVKCHRNKLRYFGHQMYFDFLQYLNLICIQRKETYNNNYNCKSNILMTHTKLENEWFLKISELVKILWYFRTEGSPFKIINQEYL